MRCLHRTIVFFFHHKMFHSLNTCVLSLVQVKLKKKRLKINWNDPLSTVILPLLCNIYFMYCSIQNDARHKPLNIWKVHFQIWFSDSKLIFLFTLKVYCSILSLYTRDHQAHHTHLHTPCDVCVILNTCFTSLEKYCLFSFNWGNTADKTMFSFTKTVLNLWHCCCHQYQLNVHCLMSSVGSTSLFVYFQQTWTWVYESVILPPFEKQITTRPNIKATGCKSNFTFASHPLELQCREINRVQTLCSSRGDRLWGVADES